MLLACWIFDCKCSRPSSHSLMAVRHSSFVVNLLSVLLLPDLHLFTSCQSHTPKHTHTHHHLLQDIITWHCHVACQVSAMLRLQTFPFCKLYAESQTTCGSHITLHHCFQPSDPAVW
eukprot:EG_transcript_28166